MNPMSALDGVGITSARLRQMADQVDERYPNAILVKNQVGGLAIFDADVYVGYLDLRFGKVDLFTDDGGTTP